MWENLRDQDMPKRIVRLFIMTLNGRANSVKNSEFAYGQVRIMEMLVNIAASLGKQKYQAFFLAIIQKQDSKIQTCNHFSESNISK